MADKKAGGRGDKADRSHRHNKQAQRKEGEARRRGSPYLYLENRIPKENLRKKTNSNEREKKAAKKKAVKRRKPGRFG